MEQDEAAARMREIQRIMERTTLYTLLPGVPAVLGGILALIGCVISYMMIGSVDFADGLALTLGKQVQFCVMWTLIGGAAVALDVVYATAAARKRGLSLVTRPGKLAALSVTPSVFVAGIFTVRLLLDGTVQSAHYVAPIWMMCYGTGVYAAGLFSVRLPRLLGLAFIIAGALGLLVYPQYGVVLVALSFGLFHIVFGVWVIRKSRQGSQE